MAPMVRLGVNIDHVATLRQARRGVGPIPAMAAAAAELGGADLITLHLREDRRHVQDADLAAVAAATSLPINLEMALTQEMLHVALAYRPHQVCLVPERREEVTTEGGFDMAARIEDVTTAVRLLSPEGTRLHVFIDPEIEQVQAAVQAGAQGVELHTGAYANARGEARAQELERLSAAGAAALEAGLECCAGHGLNYTNIQPVLRLRGLAEVNIGHAIIARAVFHGLEAAVREMRRIIELVAVESRVGEKTWS